MAMPKVENPKRKNIQDLNPTPMMPERFCARRIGFHASEIPFFPHETNPIPAHSSTTSFQILTTTRMTVEAIRGSNPTIYTKSNPRISCNRQVLPPGRDGLDRTILEVMDSYSRIDLVHCGLSGWLRTCLQRIPCASRNDALEYKNLNSQSLLAVNKSCKTDQSDSLLNSG